MKVHSTSRLPTLTCRRRAVPAATKCQDLEDDQAVLALHHQPWTERYHVSSARAATRIKVPFRWASERRSDPPVPMPTQILSGSQTPANFRLGTAALRPGSPRREGREREQGS